jgi:hypothetical protein
MAAWPAQFKVRSGPFFTGASTNVVPEQVVVAIDTKCPHQGTILRG